MTDPETREVTERDDFEEHAQALANETGDTVTAYPKDGDPFEVEPEGT